MKAKINGYINSIMEESALIKDSGMLFLASFAGSLRIISYPAGLSIFNAPAILGF